MAYLQRYTDERAQFNSVTHNHLNWFENMTGSSVVLNRHVHIQVWEQDRDQGSKKILLISL